MSRPSDTEAVRSVLEALAGVDRVLGRDCAMKVLRSRLYAIQEEERRKEQEAAAGEKMEIAWGSQIRSYVLHPYQMVKDHRIHLDIGNVNEVLDGGIDPFIEGVLLAKKHK